MQKIKSFFVKFWNLLKSIPWYGWVSTFGILLLQRAFYRLAPIIANASGSINWAFIPKVSLDDYIPIIPFFVIIYMLAFAFWFILPLVIAKRTKKENVIDFNIGMAVMLLIGFVIFVAMPTYMDRAAEGLMDIGSRGDIFSKMLQWMYDVDNGNIAYDLLPSYHCMLTIYCFFGICRQKEISRSLKIFSLISVILISLSTIFIKQHYVLDAFNGLALATVVYLLILAIEPGKRILARHAKKHKK